MEQAKINEGERLNQIKQSSLREIIDINKRQRNGEISNTEASLMIDTIIDTLELHGVSDEDIQLVS